MRYIGHDRADEDRSLGWRRAKATAIAAPLLPAAFTIAAAPAGGQAAVASTGNDTVSSDVSSDDQLLAAGPRYSVYETSDGWIEHRHTTSLEDVAVFDGALRGVLPEYEVQMTTGTRIVDPSGDGCRYSGSVSAGPEDDRDGQVWFSREMRSHPDSCQTEVESAWISEEAASKSGILPDDNAAGAHEQDASSNAQARAFSDYKNDGRIKGYVEDPPNADTSSTESRVGWTETGSGCVSWEDNSHWYWLTETGWTDVSRTNNRHLSCQHGLQTYGKYKNGVFCFTNDTFNEEDVDFHTRGHRDSWASWDVSKWGGCSWLLDTSHYYDPY